MALLISVKQSSTPLRPSPDIFRATIVCAELNSKCRIYRSFFSFPSIALAHFRIAIKHVRFICLGKLKRAGTDIRLTSGCKGFLMLHLLVFPALNVRNSNCWMSRTFCRCIRAGSLHRALRDSRRAVAQEDRSIGARLLFTRRLNVRYTCMTLRESD